VNTAPHFGHFTFVSFTSFHFSNQFPDCQGKFRNRSTGRKVAGQGKKKCSVKLTNIDFLVKKKIQQKNQ
jgi:hypothetical protein